MKDEDNFFDFRKRFCDLKKKNAEKSFDLIITLT